MDWFPRFADHGCARLADSGLRPMALCRTSRHGWVVGPGLSVLVPIGLHAATALVALTVSSGFILAPPPYRMVNAGSCDYKKKKKKNLSSVSGGGGRVGRGVFPLVDDSLDMMPPSYRSPGRSLRRLLRRS